MKTTQAVWPGLKACLERFQNVAVSLRNGGELQEVEKVDVEEDRRWITRRLSILTDELTDELVPSVEVGNRTEDIRVTKRRRLGMQGR